MIRRSGLVLGLGFLATGCYQGEWKIGVEVPTSARDKLVATRDVETWELEPTVTPYVVRLRADMTPRCRTARLGASRRTDSGRFRRTGGQYWRGLAIGSGIVGGAAALTGGSGWISLETGPYARPAMYAGGGLLAAGGVVSCILALHRPGPARKGLCAALLGSGAALLLGAGLSQIPGGPDPNNPMTSLPLIGTPVFQGLTLAGAGALGVAGAAGIVSAAWRGEVERTRVVESPQASVWDLRQGEQTCGPARPLIGRTATLEISAERIESGPGSEADPLKLRVAIGDEGVAAVDLRPLRQSLPSCGVLRVQVNPDTLYEQFDEAYVPAGGPQASGPLGRPIHGRILPPGGITLQGLEGRSRRAAAPRSVPGFAEDAIAGIERRCRAAPAQSFVARYEPRDASRGEAARAEAARAARAQEPAGPPVPPLPLTGAAPGELEVADPPEALAPPAPAAPPPPAGGRGPACSQETQQTILRDCEHSCGKSLEAAACVFDRRKCAIDARYSQQKQRDLELCDLTWEKCLFKTGVSPGAWSRCVESCQRKNEASLCRPPE